MSLPAAPLGVAKVDVTDAGFTPAVTLLGLGGTVTWANRGTRVHSATTTPGSNQNLSSFDSGGLGPGQTFSFNFVTPGTYVFTSAPDCLSGSSNGFACTNYSVIVSTTPAVGISTAPTATPTALVIPGSAAAVAVDDQHGFSPTTVNVKPGQSVTWVNYGSAVHSVVVNQNPLGAGIAPPFWLPYTLPTSSNIIFDSGGIQPQQSWTYTFTTVGTFPYHSSTEPIYWLNNQNCGCTIIDYQWFGTVNVTLNPDATPTPTS